MRWRGRRESKKVDDRRGRSKLDAVVEHLVNEILGVPGEGTTQEGEEYFQSIGGGGTPLDQLVEDIYNRVNKRLRGDAGLPATDPMTSLYSIQRTPEGMQLLPTGRGRGPHGRIRGTGRGAWDGGMSEGRRHRRD